MSDSNDKKTLFKEESCNCSEPGCCQPKPRNRWQKIAFFAVVVIAAGIIAFKLFYAPTLAPACNTKGCCPDTTKCTDLK